MKPGPRALYQFPISHYCEKARWALDAKGLSFDIVDLLPGLHRVTVKRLGGKRTVPVLVDGDCVIADSTAITEHLDRVYPERPLFPKNEADRAKATELAAYFDTAGEHVRRALYSLLLAHPGDAPRALTRHYVLPLRMLGLAAGGFVERGLRKLYAITKESAESSRAKVDEALDRLERETDGDPERRLVGGAFSIADLSAASLLAPLVAPAGTPWDGVGMRPEMIELRRKIRDRPSGQWILSRYRNDRATR